MEKRQTAGLSIIGSLISGVVAWTLIGIWRRGSTGMPFWLWPAIVVLVFLVFALLRSHQTARQKNDPTNGASNENRVSAKQHPKMQG